MSMADPLIDFQPQNILLIRLSAIGDIIMASALIPALREAWPQARLSWLTEAGNAVLLQDNPRLDKVFVWPRRHWRQLRRERRYVQLLQETGALVAQLRQSHFDLVLDLQGLLKSGVWARLSGANTRIGLGSREGSQWLMTQTLDTRTETPRIGGEYLKLACALGLKPARFDMDIVSSAQTQQDADALLRASGVSGPFAVLAPFTTRPQKHWFEERWAELGRRLADDKGWRVLLLGGPDDRDSAGRIAQAVPGLVDLAGKTSLGECAAIIAQAQLLVGVDTGLTHLGIAMATPTLALFGSTRPYLDTASASAKVLYEPLPCSPCKRHPSCGGQFDCMKQHTADKILAAALTLTEIDF
jgi:heptosyltransferase-1